VDGKSSAQSDVPVWARPDAFPRKPEGVSDFGLIDHKGVRHTASDAEELAEKVGKSRDGTALVWGPTEDRLVVPEAVPALHKSLRARQSKLAVQDFSDGLRMSLVFGLATLWTLYAAWRNSGGKVESLYAHQQTGLAALLLLIFGLVPLYEAWKTRRRLARTTASDLSDEISDAQFDTWLHRQKIPATWFLLGALLLCGVVQLYVDRSVQFSTSILRAGMLKRVALQHPDLTDGTAWWRMLTAPMLHGNPVHLLMNAAGVLYLGRRTESLARWPHLLIVFLTAMWVGGVASFYWIPDKIAVGASGGLMGLLGFLLVFEILHARLVPKPARRRLVAGVVLMGLMGLLGMSFIDNAAHAGGLLAGMVYAAIVFPSSSSSKRPRVMKRDEIVGLAAGGVIVFAAAMACLKMLS